MGIGERRMKKKAVTKHEMMLRVMGEDQKLWHRQWETNRKQVKINKDMITFNIMLLIGLLFSYLLSGILALILLW